jgi:hypothetical protein
MSALKSLSEADILDRMIWPGDAALSPEAARALLQLKFDGDATKAIERLLRSNAAGTISAEDRVQLDRNLRVGQLIDLIQAKARLSPFAAASVEKMPEGQMRGSGRRVAGQE